MEKEKRKRKEEDDGSGAKRKTGEERKMDDGGAPEDEEVEEFFAILKRIQVAVRYFQKRNSGGRRTQTAKPWNPSFEREDFEGVLVGPESSPGKQRAGLDLNTHPVDDDSDKTVESQIV